MSWKGRKVVVTGAGGFIGSHLVERLLKEEAIVTAVVRYNSRGHIGLLHCLTDADQTRLKIVNSQLLSLSDMISVLNGQEVVFNLAAHIGIPYSYVNPQDVVENNILSTLNILLASKHVGIERLVQTSTSEVFGSARQIPIAETHVLQPQSPYSASKIATDSIALSFYYSFDIPVTIVRPFNTFGPRQSARAIIPSLISQVLKRNSIRVGTTTTTRDFTYVEDTVNGFLMVADSDKSVGEVFNLGTGVEISIAELIAVILRLIGSGARISYDESRIRPEKSEVLRLCADNTKVQKLIGWVPRVQFEDGLNRTIGWIRDHLEAFNADTYNI